VLSSVLFAATGVLLGLACLNVAGLFLAEEQNVVVL
jgi:hypothetical protein